MFFETFGVPGQPRTFCMPAYVHNRGQATINKKI